MPVSSAKRGDEGGTDIASPSVAVLPFVNMSGDPDQEYFSDGISEDIITALLRVRWFRVVSRTSTFAYKGQSPDVRRAADELGARYVLEGSVRKAGNRVRITAQLIDATTGNHLWAQRFDRELEDIFAVQDEITDAITGQIEPELRKAEFKRANIIRPESLDTWEIYQRGMWHMFQPDRAVGVDLPQALDYFRRAIELDSNFGPAHSARACCCYFLVLFAQVDERTACIDEGMTAARRAVALDGEDSFARMALGCIHNLQRNYVEALAELEIALRLNPLNAQARVLHGRTLLDLGRFSEALETLEHVVRLCPNDPLIGPGMARIAEAHYCLREYDQAVEWAQKGLRESVSPQLWGRVTLMAALGQLGNVAEAKQIIDELISRRPKFSLSFVREHYPLKIPEATDHLVDGLRKAGVPE
jgi:adenylate cyclase